MRHRDSPFKAATLDVVSKTVQQQLGSSSATRASRCQQQLGRFCAGRGDYGGSSLCHFQPGRSCVGLAEPGGNVCGGAAAQGDAKTLPQVLRHVCDPVGVEACSLCQLLCQPEVFGILDSGVMGVPAGRISTVSCLVRKWKTAV